MKKTGFRLFARLAICGCAAVLAGCTTRADSNPARTATEEMLISSAADRAAQKLAPQLRPGSRVFVDAGNFEGTDSKYAISAIRAVMLQHGASLVDDKKKAETIVEIRSGALSTDRNSFLIGIPSFNIPVPFASGTLPFPELALYKDAVQAGVAKFAATAYTADGNLVDVVDPQYGFSHYRDYTLLFLISWERKDGLPDEDEEKKKEEAGNTAPPAQESTRASISSQNAFPHAAK